MLAAILALILLAQPQDSKVPSQPFVSKEVGGIKGEVHNQQGDPVPRVRITIKRPDGQNWISFTDDSGHFKVGSLPPGEYQLELSKGKYKTAIYMKVLIKANAWLLGISHAPDGQKPKGGSELILIGPPNYEYPSVLISPKTPLKTEKIPMH